MSAPDTNTRKQARRHSPALIGIAVAIVIGVVCAVLITIFAFMDSPGPDTATEADEPVETTPGELLDVPQPMDPETQSPQQ